jgi:hypothetical protein
VRVKEYDHRAREVIELFLANSLTYEQCNAALDAALAGLILAAPTKSTFSLAISEDNLVATIILELDGT